MTDLPDYLPTASLETLQQRSRLLQTIRSYFEARNYWEVETPLLSRDCVVDAYIDPFTSQWQPEEGPGIDGSRQSEIRYLQTSPEFAMKRLLTAGADRVYQITHAFRQAERGDMHNPEFSMLEWYCRGETHQEQMTFVEELVRAVYQAAEEISDQSQRIPLPTGPFTRLSYEEAFQKYAGLSALGSTAEEFARLAEVRQISVPMDFETTDRQSWQNLLLIELVEPELKRLEAVFVYDYPPEQSALARIRPGNETFSYAVSERFELYLQGIEICNGYHELTDAAELRTRIVKQSALRQQEQRPALPEESYLLSAMEAGLPACAGTALGLDRLIMLALGKQKLRDVIAFPFDRA
ncbi:Elongation factor P--(R)-beta-lysine ligase [Gimesia panareensis]|uniref:Elongation factor P--(R)-beta-lysine ligase n=1 Tax=Gimesia panareensis TaxID=2527978 RepID=A0A517Q1Q9_9PLAN|nr:EF-P lysine aminoacylase EpmA [Gimesia panareensis]QDT25546.1 Elongation factor P--(R)-beta-lysine ligase [Gimesia panareensis]